MGITEWISIGIIIFGVCYFLLLIYVILKELTDTLFYIKTSKIINRSVGMAIDSYNRTKNYEQVVYELDIILNDTISNNKQFKNKYKNLIELLDNYMLIINTSKTIVKHENDDLTKVNIKSIIETRREDKPLEEIRGVESIALNQLINTMESVNDEESINCVKQIALEIKELKETIRNTENKDRKQGIVSIVSIILSIVFGIMTFIQLFK